MTDHKRLLLLILIMTGVSLAVAAVTITALYRAAFDENRERLIETAKSQARLIEAVARFDAERERQNPGSNPGGSQAATLSQIVDANSHYKGFGLTGEFTLARRDGDSIEFLLRHRHGGLEHPEPVALASGLAEPMRRALSGLSGTVVGPDYRGVMVLAAHEPVAELDLGIVAKIDMTEIRAPFVKATGISLGAALVVVMIGAVLSLRVSEPLIKNLEKRADDLTHSNERLLREIEERKVAEAKLQESEERHRGMFKNNHSVMLLIDPETSEIVDANPAACSYYGYSKEELTRKTVSDITVDSKDQGLQQLDAVAPDHREPIALQHRLANGELRDVEIYSSSFKFQAGEIIYSIVHDVTKRRDAESTLQWEWSVNAALSELYKPLITPFTSIEKIAGTVLVQAKRLTGSEHGYVSSIDPNSRDMITHTLTEMLAGKCTVSEGDKRIIFPCGSDGRYPGLWGDSLNSRQAFYTNTPDTHPASKGVPEGHVPLERFLAVPVMLGQELVGQIALAHPGSDYNDRHLDAVRRLAEFYAFAIQRKRAEEKLQKAYEELESRVKERTAELSKTNTFLKQEVKERKRAEDRNRQQSKFLRNILESITHPFYVVDANDYKIAMANSAAAVDPESMDMACYAAIHKRDVPCGDPDCVCPVNEIKATKRPINVEHVHYDGKGAPQNVEVHGYPLFDDDGNVSQVIEYTLDITKRKRAEEEIVASLREKEVLLREVHHRVKNNLQVISSLLDLQSNLIQDDQALEVFRESRNRIRSMALIHEKLYKSKDLVQIDFAEYIRDLVGGLVAFFSTDSDKISLETQIDVAMPDIEMAICCGLIVNELVSNSLKHAFPDGREGEIVILFHTNKDNRVVLTFSDNGVGLPEHIDFKNAQSLGLQLVNTLVDQLDGDIELSGNAGTRFEIVFGITAEEENFPITGEAAQQRDNALL